MSPLVKLVIGLVGVLLLAWLHHGPLGNGERFVDRLESESKPVIVHSELTGISIRMQRNPLAREAILAGTADDFQRHGLGSQPGLIQMVDGVPGMARARWDDEPANGFVLPLLAETCLLALLAYAVGIAVAKFIWGRTPRERFA